MLQKVITIDKDDNKQVLLNNEPTKIEPKKTQCDNQAKNETDVELVPWSRLTPDELNEKKEIIQKPRKNKGEKRKTIKELTKAVLSTDVDFQIVKKVLGDEFSSIISSDEELNIYTLMTWKMIQESLSGNVRAFESVVNCSGFEKGSEKECADVMTDADRKLIDNVLARLEEKKKD